MENFKRFFSHFKRLRADVLRVACFPRATAQDLTFNYILQQLVL